MKCGEVQSVDDVGRLREWRFVPRGWKDPVTYHNWFVVTDDAVIADMRRILDGIDGASYDPILRPVLVVVGGWR